TADNGTHTFTNGVTLKTPGNQTLTATDTVTASITGSAAVNVSQLIQASKIIITPSVTSTTAGGAFSITVTAQDSSGNTATGYHAPERQRAQFGAGERSLHGHGDGAGRVRQHGDGLPGKGPLHHHAEEAHAAARLHVHGGRRRGAHLHQRREVRQDGDGDADR